MKKIPILLLTVMATHALAGEVAPDPKERSAPLEVEATADRVQINNAPAEASLQVKLINTGDADITVLTDRIDDGIVRDNSLTPTRFQFGLSVSRMTDAKGRVFAPSLPAFAPVTLHPGEFTLLQVGKTKLKRLLELPAGDRFVVRYRILESWGKRLNVWHGTVTSSVVQVPPLRELKM